MPTVTIRTKDGQTLGFGTARYPERKQPCLIVEENGANYVLGFLRDDADAEWFMRVVDKFCDTICDYAQDTGCEYSEYE